MADQPEVELPNSPANEYFGPNNGGDLVLRTCDNVDFHVHSIVLKLASPVLADMLRLGSRQSTVTVVEDAELLSIMLSFIYPRPRPQIISFETFSRALHLADKYQLAGMMCNLREELAIKGSPVSAFSDPMQALEVASGHGFAKEAELASSLVAQRFNLRQVDDLVKLAQAIPSSAYVIKLIGLPAARTAILNSVLFNFQESPMSQWSFECHNCQNQPKGGIRYSHADWKTRWAYWAFQELITRPISECGHIFKLDFFKYAIFKGEDRISKAACSCLDTLLTESHIFENWARYVQSELTKRLKTLEKLDKVTS